MGTTLPDWPIAAPYRDRRRTPRTRSLGKVHLPRQANGAHIVTDLRGKDSFALRKGIRLSPARTGLQGKVEDFLIAVVESMSE